MLREETPAAPSLPEQKGEGKAGYRRPSSAALDPCRGRAGPAWWAKRSTIGNHAGTPALIRRYAGLRRRPAQRHGPDQRQRRARAAAPRRRSPCSIPASCSATAIWEGLRLVDGRIVFLDRHLDRLWDGAKMLRIDIGLTRDAIKARLFDVDRGQRHDGRRPHPADGDPRRQALALSGSAPDRRRRDHRHHSGMEAAAPGNASPTASSFSPSTSAAPVRPSRTRSSTPIRSSTAFSPASRRWRRARTKR